MCIRDRGRAFTFVTKADEEAIDNIEKLIGVKITRMGKAAQADDDQSEDKPEKSASRSSRSEKPAARGRNAKREERPAKAVEAKGTEATKTAEPKKAAAKSGRSSPAKATRTPEPAEADWNGPMPDFLNFGFGG